MSLYVSYPEQSLKRARYDNYAVHNIGQKFARIDQLTVQEARKVFLESNSIDFQNALELETCGDLSNIHAIHKRAEELLDSSQRCDRTVLRLIKKIPVALPVKELVSPEQLALLQKYFSEKQIKTGTLINHIPHKRMSLESSWESHVTIGQNNAKIIPFYEGKYKIYQIYETILRNVIKSIWLIDGEMAIGTYKVEFYITRYFEEFNPKNNFPLHHDRYKGQKPYTYPRYSFVGMLSDKKGPHGWKGGDLIVQKDCSQRFEVGFQQHQPHLRYEYNENEGLLLKNQQAVHQVSSFQKINEKTGMARDLLQIRFFENTELQAHINRNT